MVNEPGVKKEPDQPGKAMPALWVLGTGIITGAISWYYTHSLNAAGACGAASAALLILAARTFWWRAQEALLQELQSFLLRCRVLPDDYKIVRKSSPKAIAAKKKEILDIAYANFNETEKKLVESRHILDKFVGTRASQFATAKGNKAVWEGELLSSIVLVSDVRGFTAMTEKLRPQETVRYLNRMFTELEEIITFSGGEINKFMGDSILAFYPFHPGKETDSIHKALVSALQMQDGFHQILGTFKGNYSVDVVTGLGIGLAWETWARPGAWSSRSSVTRSITPPAFAPWRRTARFSSARTWPLRQPITFVWRNFHLSRLKAKVDCIDPLSSWAQGSKPGLLNRRALTIFPGYSFHIGINFRQRGAELEKGDGRC
jgi:hypothetical protein